MILNEWMTLVPSCGSSTQSENCEVEPEEHEVELKVKYISGYHGLPVAVLLKRDRASIFLSYKDKEIHCLYVY